MTIDNSGFKLLRKPRRPTLEKVNLTRVSSDFSDDEFMNSSESESNSTLSTDREVFTSGIYVGNKPSKIIFPSLGSQKSNRDKLVMISEEGLPKHATMPKNSLNTMFSSSSSSLTESTKTDQNTNATKFKPVMRTIQSATFDAIKRANENKSKASAHTAHTTRSLVRPFKVPGPDPLPQRPVKYHITDLVTKKSFYENLSYDNQDLYDGQNQDDFALNDFLLENNYNNRLINYCIDKVFVSTRNYNQVCKLLAARIEYEKSINCDKLKVQTLVPDIEPVESRKPIRQSMIEMASYLKNELSQKTGATLKTKFNNVSKWQKMNGAQTELVIYEDKSNDKEEINDPNDQDQVTVTQLAIVDSLLRNGLVLSLKAHFIDTIPDLSSLEQTLIYINLSFNNFKEFPKELLNMPQLEVIKLRSNPIKYLPDKLSNLQNLKILTLSYCLLKEVPSCVFELENMVHLDLSYNKLKVIDEKIIKLKHLKTLNYEGNELEYLPCNMLKMKSLEKLNVKNNYLHPLIWRSLLVNQVQSLSDMSATVFCKYFGEESEGFYRLSVKAQNQIRSSFYRCDVCGEKRFGDGLRIVRPCLKIFGVKYLPFLFHACSNQCFKSFKTNK